MKVRDRWVWVTWEGQRRNRSMSTGLKTKLYEFDIKIPRWLRYPILTIKTIIVFIGERPKVIFAQNPSLVLASISVIYGRIFRITTVIDAHNAGLYPAEGSSSILNSFAGMLISWSDITIVSNNVLADVVRDFGGQPFVMPDPLPRIVKKSSSKVLRGEFNVLFVCSWSKDEPYLDVLQAAKMLERGVQIYVTGDSKGRERSLEEGLCSSVELTGFVSDDDYIELLASCDVVMVLTTRDDCLVCGAYEAVAAGKPLILSNTKALKKYFDKGCIYTKNEVSEIANAIAQARLHKDKLVPEVEAMRHEKQIESDKLLNNLVSKVMDLSA